MTSILEQLGWESLHKRRKGSKLILLLKGLKARASMPWDDLQPPNRRSRNQHPMAFQVPIISTAESSEDPVAKFTSLVRS